jgi:hypothetical protein
LYAQDKGLEGKAGGYAQNQKSAVVSAEAFCASFKLLMRQQHKEPRLLAPKWGWRHVAYDGIPS